MKYFFPILMTVLVLAGLVLTFTPYVAEQFLPAQQNSLRPADPQQIKQALASWFGTTATAITEARGLSLLSAQGSTAWLEFATERAGVERFIANNHLKQQELNPTILQDFFTTANPPAPWWQPATLQRQTYFSSNEQGRQLGLIYNAELQRGYLIVYTRKSVENS